MPEKPKPTFDSLKTIHSKMNTSFLSCKYCGNCFTQDWKAARLHSMTATQQSTAMLYTTKKEGIAGFKSDTHLQQMFSKHFSAVFLPITSIMCSFMSLKVWSQISFFFFFF